MFPTDQVKKKILEPGWQLQLKSCTGSRGYEVVVQVQDGVHGVKKEDWVIP
jgi:hypothetical protein